MLSKMKPIYLYITPFFPSALNWRGSYSLDFVKALKRTGRYEVVVFVPGDGSSYEIDGVTVNTFVEGKLPGGVFPFAFCRKNVASLLSRLKANGIDCCQISICHANTSEYIVYPLAIKRLNAACLTLLHHHDLQSFGLNGGRLRHCWFYNLYLFRTLREKHEQVDCHVFISEASRKSFLAAPNTDWTEYADYKRQMRGLPYRPVRIRRSVILHNGVDISIFRPDPSKKRFGQSFIIGCVANFDVLKEQLTLLKAVEKIEGCRVVFIGSGQCRESCECYAALHALDVEFRSEVRHNELPAFFSEIDLFVLPSYFEGFGCVYTEAWACGVPFIACEGQGIEDVLPEEDRNIWLARPQDPDDLAEKIWYYIQKKPCQRLTESVDINVLVGDYVNAVFGGLGAGK